MKESIGRQYGYTWAPGQTDERPLGDFSGDLSRVSLSRVSVQGEGLVRIVCGTGSVLEFTDLRPPLLAFIPGKWELHGRPVADQGGELLVAAVPTTGAGRGLLRQLADATAGAVGLDVRAARARVIAPATFTVAGIATGAVPVGTDVPLFGPSVLLTGAAEIHFDL